MVLALGDTEMKEGQGIYSHQIELIRSSGSQYLFVIMQAVFSYDQDGTRGQYLAECNKAKPV